MAVRANILLEMDADPLWHRAVNDAWEDYMKTGKSAKLRQVIEDYCHAKGFKVKELDLRRDLL